MAQRVRDERGGRCEVGGGGDGRRGASTAENQLSRAFPAADSRHLNTTSGSAERRDWPETLHRRADYVHESDAGERHHLIGRLRGRSRRRRHTDLRFI